MKDPDKYRPRKLVLPDGLHYKVSWPTRPRVDGKDVCGWTNFSSRCMAIGSQLAPGEQAGVFLHECVHALYPSLKEAEAEKITRLIVLLAKLNYPVLTWIVERLKPDGAETAALSSGTTLSGAGPVVVGSDRGIIETD